MLTDRIDGYVRSGHNKLYTLSILLDLWCYLFLGHTDHPRSGMVYNFGPVSESLCLYVRVCVYICQTITFESLNVGSSYLHIRYISIEYGSSCCMKVIGSKSKSQERKGRKSVTQTSFVSNFPSIKHRAVKFACSMRNSDSHASIRMSLIIHEMTPRARRHVIRLLHGAIIRLLSRCYVRHGGDYYLPALLERKWKITGDYSCELRTISW